MKLILLDGLFILLAVGALYRLFRAGETNDQDFNVYWRTAHNWVSGITPYLIRPEDQGFVIKYPPWTIPLFLPLAALPEDLGRYFWYVLQLACLAYSIRWTILQGVPARMAIFVAYLYWWMWQSHFSAGQVEIVILAAALWACPPPVKGAGLPEDGRASSQGLRSAVSSALLVDLISIKVFSLVTLAGIWRRFLNPRVLLMGVALFVLSHAVLLGVYCAGGGFEWPHFGSALVQIYKEWFLAAASGGVGLGPEIVRGQGNHGFTAFVLRSLHVDSMSTSLDILTSGTIALVLGLIWNRFGKVLTTPERWVGWVAIGVVIHPLAWHHFFILVYPLSAFAFARACESKHRGLIFLSLLGTCCIGIFVPQVIGTTIVKPLELGGMKSWGVVIAAATLVMARRVSRSGSGVCAEFA